MPRFKDLRRKVRRRRIENVLLAGYAFAVTCALFVSLIGKNDEVAIPEQKESDVFDYTTDVLTPVYNNADNENPFELAYLQINNIKLLSDNAVVRHKLDWPIGSNIVMPVEAKPEYVPQTGSFDGIYRKERRVIVVSSGDTFIGILTKLGMESKNATRAYQTLKKVYDARKLNAGQHIDLTAVFDVQTKQLETLDTLVIEPTRGTKYILQVDEYDKYIVKVEKEKFISNVSVVNGEINGYVSKSLTAAGLPAKLSGRVPQMFAQVIDFGRDVKKGDKFTVKYEVEQDSDGKIVNVGDILSVEFKLGNTVYKRYRFKSRSGDVDYYDEKGGAKKTGLDKKPLAMRNARISSMFGYRRHPIYKTTKYHSGVDYAAPQGTAIYASGAGVIEMSRYVNGYGNFIKIRHNSEYETAYAHMYKFASGIKSGVRVKKGQIIGYVGSTGRSTGPHLHFEILRKGQRIDPLKAKVATGNDLTGSQLAEFKRTIQRINNMTPKKIVKKEVKKKEENVETVESKDIGKDLAPVQADNNKLPENTLLVEDKTETKAETKSEIKVAENIGVVAKDKISDIFAAATPLGNETEKTTADTPVEQARNIANMPEKESTENLPVSENAEKENTDSPAENTQENSQSGKIKSVYPDTISAAVKRNERLRKKWSMIRVPSKKPHYTAAKAR